MLSFDAAGFQRQLENAVREIQDAVEAAAQVGEEAVAQRGLELKQEEVEKTYQRPEPRGSKRTGAFRDGQRLEGGPGERRIVTVGPAAAYEGRLANLNSERRNPAAENAHARLEEEAGQVFEDTVEQELQQRLGTG